MNSQNIIVVKFAVVKHCFEALTLKHNIIFHLFGQHKNIFF